MAQNYLNSLDIAYPLKHIGSVNMNDPEAIDDLLADLPNLATTEEIAEMMRVKPQTVLKWTKENGLKSITVGSRIRRFRKKDLRSFFLNSDEITDAGKPADGEANDDN